MPTFGWGSNEPEIKPVAQGGDTIATYASKIKNAIGDLFDTLNTFPWSNATQASAGYMSKEDKTAVDSIPGLGTFNAMLFSQTSGTYTAPRTGVFRVTLKGGGGGGGGAQTTTGRSGGGGGEGATRIIYFNLTKDTQYDYVIGAGGEAGTSSATLSEVTSGKSGGTSHFRFNGTNYTANGGGGGNHSQTTARGGAGGNVTNGIGCSLPGANGCSGVWEGYGFSRSAGGGCRGAIGDSSALTGGGGQGANAANAASAGADGFILIEYAS